MQSESANDTVVLSPEGLRASKEIKILWVMLISLCFIVYCGTYHCDGIMAMIVGVIAFFQEYPFSSLAVLFYICVLWKLHKKEEKKEAKEKQRANEVSTSRGEPPIYPE